MTVEKKTIEDRLADRLKAGELGDLMDERDINDLCIRAVEKAFFRERKTGGYHSNTLPPIVVEMAETAFRDEMKKYVTQAAEELVKKPAFQELAAQYMVTSLSTVMRDTINGIAFQTATNVSFELETRLKSEMSAMLVGLR